jgi:hypothetical protein
MQIEIAHGKGAHGAPGGGNYEEVHARGGTAEQREDGGGRPGGGQWFRQACGEGERFAIRRPRDSSGGSSRWVIC